MNESKGCYLRMFWGSEGREGQPEWGSDNRSNRAPGSTVRGEGWGHCLFEDNGP